jgi:integrase
MAGHIQDLWYAPGRRGGKPRPTARHGKGRRRKARYLDPDGRERSRSFARKADAERFLTEVEHSKIAGSYLDPDAGRVTLRSRIPLWLDSLTCDPTTRHHIELRVNRHILPKLGDKRLEVLVKTPSLIQSWVASLPVGASYAQQLLSDLSAVLDQAVTDSLIPRNPCRAAKVRAPRVVRRKLVPWTWVQVAAVREALPERYRAMADVGAGLGLRQGEIFGLSLDEVDFLHRVVHVRQQVKLYRAVTPVYGPPKGGKPRQVPLPWHVAEPLAEHIRRYPPADVVLPWQAPDGKTRTYALLFTGEKSGAAHNRSAFNTKVWVPARRAAGIPEGEDDAAGMHQLRHHYASALLAGGVDIKRVQEYLGHHSAAFTLDVYGHLMPNDEDRALRLVEAALDGSQDPPQPIASLATDM